MPDSIEDGLGVFGRQMPSVEGQGVLEMHGMAPIPLDNRCGRLHRVFSVWFHAEPRPVRFSDLTHQYVTFNAKDTT